MFENSFIAIVRLIHISIKMASEIATSATKRSKLSI